MISVSDALAHLFDLVTPLPPETVPLRAAAGRILAAPVTARRTQPPFDTTAMDGYAVKSVELEQHAQFKVIGEAAAGHRFDGAIKAGQAVRIFTGAPMPQGSDAVVIQEDVARDGDVITVTSDALSAHHVRPAGGDFHEGAQFGPKGPLTPADIALLAAMNHADLAVRPRPTVAILPTGDELVQPGETPGPDQIIASNSYGLAALLEAHGAQARLLPIARDTEASLHMGLSAAQDADLIVTIGGASVGDHDLVGDVAVAMGLERSFYKIAMRPGKPLMAGRMGSAAMVGLPGNPVSAMVCGVIFILPMIRALQGLGTAPAPRVTAQLAHDLPENGPREHYMRAQIGDEGATVFDRQDSSLLGVLAQANALAIRPPHDGPRAAGAALEFILL